MRLSTLVSPQKPKMPRAASTTAATCRALLPPAFVSAPSHSGRSAHRAPLQTRRFAGRAAQPRTAAVSQFVVPAAARTVAPAFTVCSGGGKTPAAQGRAGFAFMRPGMASLPQVLAVATPLLVRPNPSLQPTRYGWLRQPTRAAELKRWARDSTALIFIRRTHQ